MSWKDKIINEIEFTSTLSRGAGGQNVQKNKTAIYGRWSVLNSQLFSDRDLNLIQQRLANQMNNEGEILVRSEEYREQAMNRSETINKLVKMIEKALFIPKKRIKTKPTRGQKAKRVDSKKKRGAIKSQRREKHF